MSITLRETLSCVTYYDTNGNEVSIHIGESTLGSDVHPDLVVAVIRYGIKQILADAGAMSKGASDADRMARIQRRADALRNGTWGLRPARALVDADLFDAVVAAGLLTDGDATRRAWATIGKRKRDVLRADARVIPFLAPSGDGDDVLAMFASPVADGDDAPVDVTPEPTIEPAPAKQKRASKAKLVEINGLTV